MKAAWFHCFAGIAGDMTLASLLDAGADIDEVCAMLSGIDVHEWSIETEKTQRNGISSTHLEVTTQEDKHVHRSWSTIKLLIESADLPIRVKARSLTIFEKLANAEAKIHDTTPENVHFHEVGGIDAIIDIVGSCAALETLGIDHVFSSAIAQGTGTIKSAHGIIPNPPPAVIELLHGVPVHGLQQPHELTTPTGAAIIAALAENFGPMPSFSMIEASGFGAGTRELEGLPNCLQVIIGQLDEDANLFYDQQGQAILKLEINVDDVTGEVLAHTVTQALNAGAFDCWITPIIMKKGRPAYTISALSDVGLANTISKVLVQETGSFGIRATRLERWPVNRSFSTVAINGETISIKFGPHRAKAEFDEAVNIASTQGVPVRDVIHQAENNWKQKQ